MRATDLLREDHRRVHDMFLRLEALPPGPELALVEARLTGEALRGNGRG